MIKQVIMMRTDLNMRKGKMIAQGAHASMLFLVKSIFDWNDDHFRSREEKSLHKVFNMHPHKISLTTEEKHWVEGDFTKICLRVDSEQELLDLVDRARQADLAVHLVKDSGKTEFGGVPTYTCAAIGPHESEKIDKITGNLKLL